MPVSELTTLLLYILIVGYTPGPANIYSMSCAIKYGRNRALVMWRGLFVGFSIAVTVAAFVSHYLGTVMGEYVIYLRYVGALYILWLAWCLFRNSGSVRGKINICSFWSGVIMQLTNAKMILFDFTVFSIFVLPYSHDIKAMLPVAALLLLAGPGANLVWLLVGDKLRHIFAHYHKQVDLVMAVALALCAVAMIL